MQLLHRNSVVGYHFYSGATPRPSRHALASWLHVSKVGTQALFPTTHARHYLIRGLLRCLEVFSACSHRFAERSIVLQCRTEQGRHPSSCRHFRTVPLWCSLWARQVFDSVLDRMVFQHHTGRPKVAHAPAIQSNPPAHVGYDSFSLPTCYNSL